MGEFQSATLLLTPLLIVVFGASGCYTYVRSYQTRYKIFVILQAVTFTFVVMGALAFLAPSRLGIPRSVLVMAGIMSVLAFTVSRLWSATWRYVVQVEEQDSIKVPTSRTGGKMTVLVIGGAGYIGSALLPYLLKYDCRVRVLDLFLYGTDPIADVLGHPALEVIRADFRQVDLLVKAMRGIDCVVHLGGIVGDLACAIDEELTIDVNLAATRLIAEVARGSGVKRFIFASTCSVYGASEQILDENSELNPLSLYARSKIASEVILKDMADELFAPVIIRFGTIYGFSGRTRFDLVVNLLTAKAVIDGEITVFGGNQWRPFVHVDDAARAIWMLLRLPNRARAEIFNVGSTSQNYTIRQIGEIIKRQVPEARLVCTADSEDGRNYRVSFARIERMVGFKVRWSIEDGVRQVADAIKAGHVRDYREARYSNVKFMSEVRNGELAPPQHQWAHDLLSVQIAAADLKLPRGRAFSPPAGG